MHTYIPNRICIYIVNNNNSEEIQDSKSFDSTLRIWHKKFNSEDLQKLARIVVSFATIA